MRSLGKLGMTGFEIKDMFYVYMVTNKSNHVLYLGVTNSLAQRIFDHREGLITGFTEQYRVSKLVYYEDFPEAKTAIAREKQLKGWRREKKNALVAKLNPQWNDLYDEIVGREENLVKPRDLVRVQD